MLLRRHADTLSFVRSLELHHSVNWHAAVLLVSAALSGLLFSWILLRLGLEAPWLRFPIAVVAAYGLFLLFVYWWLCYIGIKRNEVSDGPQDFPVGGEGESGEGACVAEGVSGGGGSFDGGGASASFEAVGAKGEVAVRGSSLAARAGSVDPNIAAVGADDVLGAAAGAVEFFPVAVLVAVVVGVVAAIGWTVMLTPALLVEIAVEVAVAAGLVRGVARSRARDWLETAFERTAGKAVALALVALLLGAVVRWIDPSADTVGQAIAHLTAR